MGWITYAACNWTTCVCCLRLAHLHACTQVRACLRTRACKCVHAHAKPAHLRAGMSSIMDVPCRCHPLHACTCTSEHHACAARRRAQQVDMHPHTPLITCPPAAAVSALSPFSASTMASLATTCASLATSYKQQQPRAQHRPVTLVCAAARAVSCALAAPMLVPCCDPPKTPCISTCALIVASCAKANACWLACWARSRAFSAVSLRFKLLAACCAACSPLVIQSMAATGRAPLL